MFNLTRMPATRLGQSVRVSLCAIYDSPGGKADPKSSCKISGTW
ncbi:hypothetical protein [Desulfonema limicola]|nr:hypothetical protein [Desulfonema limicola]